MKRHLLMLALTVWGSSWVTACVTDSSSSSQQAVTASERVEPDLDEAARINTELGMNYARAGNLDLALDKFKRALSQNESYAPAHQGIAYIYVLQKDPQRAEEHYRRALKLSPRNAPASSNYGIFLCGQERYEEAERHFLKAAENRDYRQRHTAYVNAGVCARRIPDLDKAERFFLLALDLSPRFPEALQQMAGLYLERRDYAQSKAFLKRYEQVGPPTPATLWIGAKVEFALGDEVQAAQYARRLRDQFPDSKESLSFTNPYPS